jgi:hypothetical protein
MLELNFWLGLALSIPLSILANVFTPKLLSYLERRKILKTHRTRSKEKEMVERAREFKSGKRDKYAYYFLCALGSIFFMIVGSSVTLVLLLTSPNLDNLLIGVAVIAASLVLCASLFMSIHITGYNIDNFADCERRFKERWPDKIR